MIIMVSVGFIFAGIQVAVYVRHNLRVLEGKGKSQGEVEPIVYTP